MSRTFRSTIPHSSFVAPDCNLVRFDGSGYLETSDEDLIKALDAVADKAGCPIYRAESKEARISPELESNGALKLSKINAIAENEPDLVQKALVAAHVAKASQPSVATGVMGSVSLSTAKS